jgi:hypothetical protein
MHSQVYINVSIVFIVKSIEVYLLVCIECNKVILSPRSLATDGACTLWGHPRAFPLRLHDPHLCPAYFLPGAKPPTLASPGGFVFRLPLRCLSQPSFQNGQPRPRYLVRGMHPLGIQPSIPPPNLFQNGVATDETLQPWPFPNILARWSQAPGAD